MVAGWLGLSVSPKEGAALGYQPAPGNSVKNHSKIAIAKAKMGDLESPCIGAGKCFSRAR